MFLKVALRDVTCIHRLHMEDTTSYRDGGLSVFENISLRDVTCILDSTWKIRRHIATEAYVFLKMSLRDVTCIHRLHMKDNIAI